MTRRTEKAVFREAMKLYSHSDQFPVRRFRLDVKTGEVLYRWFRGDYGWMDELIHACARHLRAKPAKRRNRK